MENNNKNHILSLIWVLLLVFPNNTLYFVIVPICYIIIWKFKSLLKGNLGLTIALLCGSLFLSVSTNLNESYFTSKDLNRVVVLILMFASFGKLRGSKILSPYIYFATAFLVLSQIAAEINFTQFVSFINTYYGNSEDGDISTRIGGLENYGSFRLGGIFSNPNQYARYLELIMLVALCEVEQFKRRNLIILLIIIALSLVATGSRTSLIVFATAIFFYLYSSGVLTRKKAILISFLVSLLFGFITLFSGLQDARILKVDEGLDNSLGVKVNLLKLYLQADVSIEKLLIGNGSLEAFSKYTGLDIAGMDFEFGNIILSYGVLFFLLLVLFYFKVYNNLFSKYRVLFVLLLWMFSSSILLSFRMAALWLLILGTYYKRSQVEKKS